MEHWSTNKHSVHVKSLQRCECCRGCICQRSASPSPAKSWVAADADVSTCIMLPAINQIRPPVHRGRCMAKLAVAETCSCSVILFTCVRHTVYRYCICCLYCSVIAENTLLCFNFTSYFLYFFAPKYAKICASIYKNASASGGRSPPDPLPGLRPWTPLGDFRISCPPNPSNLATPLIMDPERVCATVVTTVA